MIDRHEFWVGEWNLALEPDTDHPEPYWLIVATRGDDMFWSPAGALAVSGDDIAARKPNQGAEVSREPYDETVRQLERMALAAARAWATDEQDALNEQIGMRLGRLAHVNDAHDTFRPRLADLVVDEDPGKCWNCPAQATTTGLVRKMRDTFPAPMCDACAASAQPTSTITDHPPVAPPGGDTDV